MAHRKQHLITRNKWLTNSSKHALDPVQAGYQKRPSSSPRFRSEHSSDFHILDMESTPG